MFPKFEIEKKKCGRRYGSSRTLHITFPKRAFLINFSYAATGAWIDSKMGKNQREKKCFAISQCFYRNIQVYVYIFILGPFRLRFSTFGPKEN